MSSTAALVQTVLEGVALPAGRAELEDYARRQGADAETLERLRRLPDREFRFLDEVGEALDPVQPGFAPPPVDSPKPSSGDPLGGDHYTNGG